MHNFTLDLMLLFLTMNTQHIFLKIFQSGISNIVAEKSSYGRTTSSAQIPACSFLAPVSSIILTSVIKSAIPRSKVCKISPVLHVRIMLSLQAAWGVNSIDEQKL